MSQVRIFSLLVVVALVGCVHPKNLSQPTSSDELSDTIMQAQLGRLDKLADTAKSCKGLKSDAAQKTWEKGFADAQADVDKTVGPLVSKQMQAAGEDQAKVDAVWDKIENGYRVR